MAEASQPTVERRVVTTLFCDLVDFTAMCERFDPEDVDRLLREYCALARAEVERFGGVVEKFVGDAVVGVFGIPAVHEDDPERAIRAGLVLRDRVSQLQGLDGSACRVRVGVNTGPALVRLDVDPATGEGFLVGDAVNIAARLQSLAPPMGVIAGESTYALTRDAFVYDSVEPVAVKGKAQPLRAWLARAPIARRGIEASRAFSTRFVGRDAEMASLRGLFDASCAAGAPRFALVVGEAGIGKSRVLFELARSLDDEPGLMVTWRQGRCLAYGDAPAFWALSEMVKAHCGILDSDAVAVVGHKLSAGIPGDLDVAWARAHLGPLVGLPGPPTTREDNFACWTQFLCGLAAVEPTVLVFEDLHWADEGTQAFLEVLAMQAAEVPLFVVGTARPEFMESPGGSASVGAGWVPIRLTSLSSDETGLLLKELTKAASVPDAIRREALVRCGGNPFFTEELVRVWQERGRLRGTKRGLRLLASPESEVPGSLQGLIASRLDTLKRSHKELLANAAVVGQSFWLGAVAAVAGTGRAEVEEAMLELAGRELVRPLPESSTEGEEEYCFWHAVTRDVAYEQLPRVARAHKHAAVAAWIEQHDPAHGSVEILVRHYTMALALARAAGQTDLAAEVLGPTIDCLTIAGERALVLDVGVAEQHLAHAVKLAGERGAVDPHLLVAWADTVVGCGRLRDAEAILDEGIAGLMAINDLRAAAAALTRLSRVRLQLGDAGGATLAEQALSLLDGDVPSPELATVLAHWVFICMSRFESRAAVDTADRVLRLCDGLGLPVPAQALGHRGMARCDLGDGGGLADLDRAVRAAMEQSQGRTAAIMLGNLADVTYIFSGAQAALRLRRRGLEHSTRRREAETTAYLRVSRVEDLLWTGKWEQSLTLAAELDGELRDRHDVQMLAVARSARALLLAWTGLPEDAVWLAEWAEESSRTSLDLEVRLLCVFCRCVVEMTLGRRDEARHLLVSWDAIARGVRGSRDYSLRLPEAARIAVAIGEVDLAVRLTEGLRLGRPLDSHAALSVSALCSERRSDMSAAERAYAAAAKHWARFGIPYEYGQALLGRGRCLLALRSDDEANASLRQAADTFARLGAAPALAKAHELMSAGGILR